MRYTKINETHDVTRHDTVKIDRTQLALLLAACRPSAAAERPTVPEMRSVKGPVGA